MTDALGARHTEVKRLRALLRDSKTRDLEGAFVLEGPRVVAAALDRGASLEVVYLGPGASTAFGPLVERLDAAGVRRADLKEGVLEKVGLTRTPQPVLAVATGGLASLDSVKGQGIAVVAVDVADPGNLGTILRSAEAAGADAVIVCGTSVDPRNPKVVRSSAGACFGMPVIHTDDAIDVLDRLRGSGRRLIGTVAHGGEPYDSVDLVSASALVVGNEAHGLGEQLRGKLDHLVSIPMIEPAESLNVAMAATVVLFDAARQRRLARAHP
ncbi:MAG: RNA methyltransferase [Acidimicrobiia bacterium]